MPLTENPILLDRLFYSIPKAVRKINNLLAEKNHIDEHDLLHFYMIGKLEICFHLIVNGADFDGEGDNSETKPTLEFSACSDDDINEVLQFLKTFSDSHGKAWISTDYGVLDIDYSIDEKQDSFDAIADHRINSADVLLALPRTNMMTSSDEIIENGLCALGAKIPRTTNLTILESSDLLSINIPTYIFFSERINIKYSNLIITHKELELFLNGGKDIPYEDKKLESKNIKNTSNKRINAQAKFIKALIIANYGAGVANNVRWNINTENNNKNDIGKIRQHFQKQGLDKFLPEGKTVENWIKDIELDID